MSIPTYYRCNCCVCLNCPETDHWDCEDISIEHLLSMDYHDPHPLVRHFQLAISGYNEDAVYMTPAERIEDGYEHTAALAYAFRAYHMAQREAYVPTPYVPLTIEELAIDDLL